jgi:hypothetical protein
MKLLLENAELVAQGVGYSVSVTELLGEHEHLSVLLGAIEALRIPSPESLEIESARELIGEIRGPPGAASSRWGWGASSNSGMNGGGRIIDNLAVIIRRRLVRHDVIQLSIADVPGASTFVDKGLQLVCMLDFGRTDT